MSELDLSSRREADQLLVSGRVKVKGEVAHLGQKVDFKETDITIVDHDDRKDEASAIVLNKPIGYVSGQPEDGHLPAIKLVTLENCLHATKGYQQFFDNRGFVAAGRLDLTSTGLLIFSKSGVLAKKLVSASGKIEKEYVVSVERAQHISRVERDKGMTSLPTPSHDLKVLTKGGKLLFGEARPLKPVQAKWIDRGEKLRIVLKEGRKHQIRRMLRELIGFHVIALERVRIGPVLLEDLPQGRWRPLTKAEVDSILSS
jgi:23S rRNA pseudouridine2604 synthase